MVKNRFAQHFDEQSLQAKNGEESSPVIPQPVKRHTPESRRIQRILERKEAARLRKEREDSNNTPHHDPVSALDQIEYIGNIKPQGFHELFWAGVGIARQDIVNVPGAFQYLDPNGRVAVASYDPDFLEEMHNTPNIKVVTYDPNRLDPGKVNVQVSGQTPHFDYDVDVTVYGGPTGEDVAVIVRKVQRNVSEEFPLEERCIRHSVLDAADTEAGAYDIRGWHPTYHRGEAAGIKRFGQKTADIIALFEDEPEVLEYDRSQDWINRGRVTIHDADELRITGLNRHRTDRRDIQDAQEIIDARNHELNSDESLEPVYLDRVLQWT